MTRAILAAVLLTSLYFAQKIDGQWTVEEVGSVPGIMRQIGMAVDSQGVIHAGVVSTVSLNPAVADGLYYVSGTAGNWGTLTNIDGSFLPGGGSRRRCPTDSRSSRHSPWRSSQRPAGGEGGDFGVGKDAGIHSEPGYRSITYLQHIIVATNPKQIATGSWSAARIGVAKSIHV
jgi:hypothetical protein